MLDYKWSMHTQRVLLGEVVIGREPPIELFVDLPRDEAGKKAAALKDRLAFLLDTRFRPANPEPLSKRGLAVEEVAVLLHCHCRTVLRLIRRGKLHPISDEDGGLYFDRKEVESVKAVPINPLLPRLIPRS